LKQANNTLWKTRNRVFYAAIQSIIDKHVSRLAASAIKDDRRCWSGRDRRWCGRTASPASKAFNESHPRRPRHLMSLVLPTSLASGSTAEVSNRVLLYSHYWFIQVQVLVLNAFCF